MDTPNASPAASSPSAGRNFLVLGLNKWLVIQVLLALRTAFPRAGCVAVCDPRSRLMGLSNLCSPCLKMELDGADDERFVGYANRHAQSVAHLLIVTADCEGARMLGRVRHRLRADVFPFPDAATIDCFDDKWRFYQFCVERGMNVPRTCFVASKHELEFAPVARELGIPFVVKPLAQCSTQGVEVIGSKDELQRRIVGNDAYRYAPLIAQRYVRGVDVGLDLLALRGTVKALAVQQREQPQDEGAAISFISNSYLEYVAHTVVQDSSYDGVMNIDARIEEGTGKVFLLESNPRFWRSLSASTWCGLNFVAEWLEPTSPDGAVRKLDSGRADTHFHPLLRPSLLRQAMFGEGHRKRMARLMANDICTLLGQIKRMLGAQAGGGRPDGDQTRASGSPRRGTKAVP
jgi:predicted ATP-grasp superfamily ATP-dependent carboligase